jgi:anti-sigma B factor antagonist
LTGMDLHQNQLEREQLIASYLLRRLDANSVDEFENHYLECDVCFEELRVSELLLAGLSRPGVERRDVAGVVMLDFTAPAQLTAGSRAFDELSRNVLQQADTKVLIDLSRVSRIDSSGLGLLMSCYSHVIRKQGSFKLLHPPTSIRKIMEITRINSVLETYDDESEALRSFEHQA